VRPFGVIVSIPRVPAREKRPFAWAGRQPCRNSWVVRPRGVRENPEHRRTCAGAGLARRPGRARPDRRGSSRNIDACIEASDLDPSADGLPLRGGLDTATRSNTTAAAPRSPSSSVMMARWISRRRRTVRCVRCSSLLLRAGAAPAGADRRGAGDPDPFLQNILVELRHGEIVEAQPGHDDGFRLARPAAEITLPMSCALSAGR